VSKTTSSLIGAGEFQFARIFLHQVLEALERNHLAQAAGTAAMRFFTPRTFTASSASCVSNLMEVSAPAIRHPFLYLRYRRNVYTGEQV